MDGVTGVGVGLGVGGTAVAAFGGTKLYRNINTLFQLSTPVQMEARLINVAKTSSSLRATVDDAGKLISTMPGLPEILWKPWEGVQFLARADKVMPRSKVVGAIGDASTMLKEMEGFSNTAVSDIHRLPSVGGTRTNALIFGAGVAAVAVGAFIIGNKLLNKD